MKKRKTYEISVIDKTYSKIISDETKFYTSDTALELAFELKETEYNFESAEIVLLNVDDRSLVTRPVAKSLDGFTYELDDDIIAHYGDWRGQLRFEQAGEVYVSSPVKFRIENDLSNDRPPQLSDVQSWVSLKRYADNLTEELKRAVLSVDGIEDTFNENETIRQSQFETAEQSRQSTFNANEDIRQTQELEREEAENQRQSEFDNNEANRTETFNANEATRQENETTRQQAESQRQSTFEVNEIERQTTFETAETQRESSELIRVSAEGQRKIDHANRSVELASKADKVVLNNLVNNGNFSNGGEGWKAGSNITNITYGDSYVEFVGGGTSSGSNRNWVSHVPSEMPNDSDVMYIYSLVTRTNGEGYIYIGFGYSVTSGNIPLNTKTLLSYRDVPKFPSVGINRDIVLSAWLGVNVRFESVISLNLTQTFGAGNEPTKEEMDELIKVTGYIDSEYALNNKEMLIWTLALIRRNKNAIITLGGTI